MSCRTAPSSPKPPSPSRVCRSPESCRLFAILAAIVTSAGAAAPPADASPGQSAAKTFDEQQPPRPRYREIFAGAPYIVRDLGVTVPFTWEGKGGNSEMASPEAKMNRSGSRT